MSTFITPSQLSCSSASFVLLDVRKVSARLTSMLTIPGALYREPSTVEHWWVDFAGKRLAVFCVHGHEVSRTVCGFLREKGVDAACLEGGFEAWRAGGFPVALIGAEP